MDPQPCKVLALALTPQHSLKLSISGQQKTIFYLAVARKQSPTQCVGDLSKLGALCLERAGELTYLLFEVRDLLGVGDLRNLCRALPGLETQLQHFVFGFNLFSLGVKPRRFVFVATLENFRLSFVSGKPGTQGVMLGFNPVTLSLQPLIFFESRRQPPQVVSSRPAFSFRITLTDSRMFSNHLLIN